MFLLTDGTLIKANSGMGFYILAYLPIAVLVVFAIIFIMKRKK